MPKHLNTADDFEMVAIERLKPHPNNVNEADTGAVIESIKAHGFYGALVVQRSTCHVVAGNHRLLAARTLGFSELPVTWITCDDEMAIRLMLTDNRSTRLGRDNPAALAELLAELAGTEQGLVGLGFDGDDLDQLLTELAGMPQSGLLDDADPDAIPDDAPTRVKPGELWQLGNHRILCGDSTKPEDVARLMGGEKFNILVTSPPYNSGNGGYKTDYDGAKKRFYLADTDKRTEDDWVAFCEEVLNVAYTSALDGETVIVWNVMYNAGCREGYGRVMFGGKHPFTVKETICWDKSQGFPTASKGILSRNWELVFVLSSGPKYFTNQGENEPRWAKWDIPRPQKQADEHKATFPIDLACRALNDFSDTGSIAYEPFCGTGTTLIAAEQLGRKCYGIELEPKYCDVILSRYEQATGKTAELIENGTT